MDKSYICRHVIVMVVDRNLDKKEHNLLYVCNYERTKVFNALTVYSRNECIIIHVIEYVRY